MSKSAQELLKSMALTDPQRNLLAGGFCPECERGIRGEWVPIPKGMHFMGPEIMESLRESGIDTRSGHKNSCSLKGLRL